MQTERVAHIQRRTSETEIELTLSLDGTGKHRVATGVGFLDHMLAHVAVHGLFDLDITAHGDLEIDEHHTVEDVAIVLGQALDRTLGDRRGLVRMGHAYVPMDESLALVAIDLSGRPYAVIDAVWHTPAIGHMGTSLIAHFLETLAVHARMNLHARVLYGRDDHHQAEALFKALGRALDQATLRDPRRGEVPSTKGTLTA
jgi:imidazoleglycerol-phosphate dehydratase